MSGQYFQANLDSVQEDEDTQVTFGGKEGILFVIDAASSMLDEHEGKEANLRLALRAIEASMKNLVVGNQRDLVGIVFYNTQHSPKPRFEEGAAEIVVPQHTCILLPMDVPSVESISYVTSFHSSDDSFDFHNRYGCDGAASFADVIWLCTKMFQKCGYKLQSSVIVLFTDNHLPHAANIHEHQQAFVKAKDLNQLNVEFTLIPMREDFDGDLFYKEFICTVMDMEMENFELDVAVKDVETISSRIYRRNYRKRCNNYLKFSLGEGLELSVGLYSSVRHVKYPKSFMVDRNTNEVITRKRVQEVYDDVEQTMVALMPHQQKKFQEIGGRRIIFTTQELATMKTFLPAGLRLLGFKPRSAINVSYYIRHGSFIYPDETSISGSTKLFRALWQRCLDRNVVAICVLTLRYKSPPGYVALLPQENVVSGQDQVEYNGFHLMHLPILDDVRDFSSFSPQVTTVSEEQVLALKGVVKKLKFRYNPKHFSDPVLKNLYSNIEAFAFKTDGEEAEDTTLPNASEQDEQIAEHMPNIIREFGEIVVINEGGSESGKRKNTEPGENARKAARSQAPVDKDHIVREFSLHREGKLTVAILKAYAQQVGLSTQGAKKADLIELIRQHHNL
ncbi:ATP-dependent DNA helicase 2 subunit 1 [Phlebotomus argentipes]|uniref:ATP-dependent DNA helicase 2 subunit 1 n=1 Tax=Phlebotomus argentipes TaxID=94469 RepID=UPI0028934E34|nr:ATP-dependent DNA helicase 2 subunit 1 [Phlebotomus argentipes]